MTAPSNFAGTPRTRPGQPAELSSRLGDSARRAAPLCLIAMPATIAIWSGWVGLGQMSGFGVAHPLPGIADSFEINLSITLPIGIEAYSAYAFGTWLSGRPMPRAARRFAMVSSIIGQALGLFGQIVYHILAALGHQRAPLGVVGFVSCLPVLVFGAAAVLHHLKHSADPDEQTASTPGTEPALALDEALPPPGWAGEWLTSEQRPALPSSPAAGAAATESEPAPAAADHVDRSRIGRTDVSDLLEAGRAVAADLARQGIVLNRRSLAAALRARELSCGTERANELVKILRAEAGDHVGQLEAVS